MLVAALAVVGLTGFLAARGVSTEPTSTPDPGPTITYTNSWTLLDLARHIEAGEVVAITATGAPSHAAGSRTTPDDRLEPGPLAAKTRDGQLIAVRLNVPPSDALGELASIGYGELLTEEAWASVRAARAPGGSDPVRGLFESLLPLTIVGLFAVIVLRSMLRSGPGVREGGSTFSTVLPGKAESAARSDGSARGEGPEPATVPAVRLADVAGCDEAKLELTETIEFLRSPEKFRRLGARIPRGIILHGPPGTGKTMLAKAVASEAGVAFLFASGSEFVEKYVGVGARRIRDLFAQARKLGRAVIFVDEFDAIGKTRGGQTSHEEREQTLNQLLVELDGFATTDDVVVIAATNRVDTLDPAVMRPGRITRKIYVGLPDVRGRAQILAVHAHDKPLAMTVDLEAIARKTYGFSGAQLADLLNEAAILAARRGGNVIGPEDIHAGWLKTAVGTSRRRSMDERERSIIAAHEVGHAICGRVHGDRRRVEEISLFAHGEAFGVTVSSQEDNDLPAESDLRARLIALMGGRAAEEMLFREVTGGAANDFDQANQIATRMVMQWGMGRDPQSGEAGPSGRGALSFLVARPGEAIPNDIQSAATRAVRALLDEAYIEARRTLLRHLDTVRRIAAYLVEHERLDGETFDALFDGKLAAGRAAGEWRPAAARPRSWAEVAALRDGREPGGIRCRDRFPVPAGSDDADAPSVAGVGLPILAPSEVGTDRGDGGRSPLDRRRMVRRFRLGQASRGPRSGPVPIGRWLRGLVAAFLLMAEAAIRPDTEWAP